MSLLPIINGTKNDRFGIIKVDEKNTNQEKTIDRKKTPRDKSPTKPVESPDGPSITGVAALGIDGPRRRPRPFPLPVARGGLPRGRPP